MFQYYPFLQSRGVELTTRALFGDEYLDLLYSKKSRWACVLKSYFRRFFVILYSSKKYDLVWLEKELFPWVPWSLEKWLFKVLSVPYVVDFDDAIFHQYDLHRFRIIRSLLGQKCDQVMQNSACFVAGNEYLAQRGRKAGARKIVKIPTVVSEKVFYPKNHEHPVPIIGWIGSMSTAIYLDKLYPVLRDLSKKYDFKFRVVGATLEWKDIPLECVPWSEEKEVSLIQSFDIGVMPLVDSPWEKGKCGFKLVQYMACGKPAVADSVGANVEIIEDGKNGYLVSDGPSWERTIENLLVNPQQQDEMGRRGRSRFQKYYSLESWQDFILKVFQEVSRV